MGAEFIANDKPLLVYYKNELYFPILKEYPETDILEEADIDVVETVIALSSNDESNILASLMAKKYGAERLLA